MSVEGGWLKRGPSSVNREIRLSILEIVHEFTETINFSEGKKECRGGGRKEAAKEGEMRTRGSIPDRTVASQKI